MRAFDEPLPARGLLELDPWLEPYAGKLRDRYNRYLTKRQQIIDAFGSLDAISRGHEYLGFNRGQRDGAPGVWYREWAPGAVALSLIGDFNHWNRMADPLHRDPYGVWSVFLPDAEYGDRLVHGSRVKVHVHSGIGPQDRIPAMIRRVIQEEETKHFVGQYWEPPQPYAWRHAPPAPPAALRIYEAHVGMAVEEPRIGTYSEFARDIVPRIADGGYNAVQLMAIQEHPYYGSFGYQVSNFFAPSSRFGTPEELKTLIDEAHRLGLVVLLDLVHSHAVKNLHEGLNHFDGTEYQYFHAGGRGQHPAWDSLLFDYSKLDVLRFLLSNVRYWMEEFQFDGFRFDGVTSMMYQDHGLGWAYTSYDDFFPPRTDDDAIIYLQLANELAHLLDPDAITAAEDVSGMAGLARPIEEGGVGFDYRLAMGLPDYWIKLLKEQRDEDWPMDGLYHTVINRRAGEKHIAYAESHDQALVGDKTLSFWLMDADMYWHMHAESQNLVIERGVALHKMIRLISFALGGEAYLNFMGNEFGHPEWIDFPREGNNWSFQHARRQWSLADNPELRYHGLAEFDGAMQRLDVDHGLLSEPLYAKLFVHEDWKLLGAHRGPLVLLFNFHPTHSPTDFRVGVPEARNYKLLLNTDNPQFDGHGLVAEDVVYPVQSDGWHERAQSIQVYLPARTAQVLVPV